MKKIKILTPILGLTAVAAPLLSATSCNNATQVGKLEWSGAKVKTVTHSDIELNKELTIVVVCEDNYILSGVEALKVGDTVLTLNSDFTVDLITGTIVIKADAMKNLNVNIRLSTEAEPVIKADITSLYDEYLKTIETYTTEKAAINYLFESALVSTLAGMTVQIKNFKIDGATPEKSVPADLISSPLTNNQFVRVDFNIVKLFEYYEIENDCVVTFDLQFKDSYTSLDKTISGYKLNIKVGEAPTPTEEFILTNENGGILEFVPDEQTYGCSYPWRYNWCLKLSEVFADVPKLLEKLNCNTLNISDFNMGYSSYSNISISFAQDNTVDTAYLTCGVSNVANLPSCVKTLKFTESSSTSTQSALLYCPASTDTSKENYGFETIDLHSGLTELGYTSLLFVGGIYNSNAGTEIEAGSLYRNLNLKKIILSPYRATKFTVYDDGEYTPNEVKSPFCGCENLNTFDLTAFTDEASLDRITFENGNGDNKIFYATNKTNAKNGTIIVNKDSTDAFIAAVKTKFETAGLTIDDNNWKIEKAE